MEIDRELLEEIIEDLHELEAEWRWKKDEPRCGYQKSYHSLCDRIQTVRSLLNAAEKGKISS
jgi:hypothetical protein